MAFGTDATIDVPGRTRADLMLDYLAVWRAADVPPADILRAMTVDAAELLRINKAGGSIAVGLSADLVATPANPLVTHRDLRRIDFIKRTARLQIRPLNRERRQSTTKAPRAFQARAAAPLAATARVITRKNARAGW
jgi:cytosine/adenosine deaminase-related metal-dependent hydrolase